MKHEARLRGSELSQCKKKRRYHDAKEAKRVRSLRRGLIDHDLRVYDCPFCKGFHLTKETER